MPLKETISSARVGARVSTPPVSRWHRAHRGWFIAALVFIGVMVALRFGGSPMAKGQLNQKLAAVPGYTAHADKVQLALWRGTVDVGDFVVFEKGHENEEPVVRVNKAAMRLAPGALFTGKLSGAVVVDGVEINIVKREPVLPKARKDESSKQPAKETMQQVERWQDSFRKALPLQITKLEIKNLKFRFMDRTHQPNVDVGINNLHLLAVDLQNRPKANGDPLPAKVELTGVTTGGGQLHASLQLDPISESPHFAAKFEIRDLALPPFNSFLLAYVNADVSKGSFEMASEINAQSGGYDGYVKPLFKDLDFRTASDKDKNAAQLFTKKVVAGVASLLKNRDQKQVATKAPFVGNFSDSKVDIWTTIANLFRNAFVQALTGGFEGQTPRR